MQFPCDGSWEWEFHRVPGWLSYQQHQKHHIKRMDLRCITPTFSKCRAIRFEHKGGSCNMVCCWQGLVKQRRSADKSRVWIRFIAVNAIVATWCIDCETILLHDYWMVQTNMFSAVLQYRCGGCRSGSPDFDWCDVMVWFPLFKELWFSQVLRFWYVKYKCVLSLCKLSISAGCRAWVQLITRRNQTMSCQTYVYFKAGFISSCACFATAALIWYLSWSFHAFLAVTSRLIIAVSKEASSRSFVAYKGAEGETIRTWAIWLLGCWGHFGFQLKINCNIQDSSDWLTQSLHIM